MKVGIILHLYQPPTQSEEILKKVTDTCYIPLFKLIEKKREHHFTLNISLSLIEQFDIYGYKDLIEKIKKLYAEERISLVGSAAYHPLLTKIPQNLIEEQIILNEYGLGYYLGSTKDFEGDPSIVIRDLNGFFPPEMAVNEDIINTLIDFGYKWVVTESDGKKGSEILEYKDSEFFIVRRDKHLSNFLAFKREVEISDIKEYVKNSGVNTSIIALDGETFGHHFNEGVYLLEHVLEYFKEEDIFVSKIEDIIFGSVTGKTDFLEEINWSKADDDNDYPLWTKDDKGLQDKLWEIEKDIYENFNTDVSFILNDEELYTLPFWKSDALEIIGDPKVGEYVYYFILLHKFLHSDKYWWLSDRKVFDNHLLDYNMILKALKYAEILIEYVKDDKRENILGKIETLKSSIS